MRSLMRFGAASALSLGLLACGPTTGSGSRVGGANRAAEIEAHPLIGAAAPAFELDAPGGKQKVSLAAHAGKVVIVDFWATWCAPCHESFPAYQRLAEKFGDQLVVIGVSVDDDPAGIPEFAKETGAMFPLAWDDGQITSKSYQPPKMPTSYVVDQSGIVRFVHSGFHSGEEQALESEIRSLLK